MSMLLRLLRWDFVMQIRQGFWVAGVFVLLPSAGIILSVSQQRANSILPAVIFLDVAVTGTLFMAGVYFFEKREGSIQALAVSPIKTWQWLTSKIIALTFMITVMACSLVFIKKGIHASWGYIIISCICISLAYAMMGFILASPFDGFSDFIVAFALFFAVMEIPALSYFGISHWLLWLIPTHPTLLLLRGALEGTDLTTFLTYLGVQIFWLVVAFYLCIRLFHRYVADRKEGSDE